MTSSTDTSTTAISRASHTNAAQALTPGAPRWDIQVVAQLLRAHHREAVQGHDGWHASPDGWDVMITRSQGVHGTRPRGPAGKLWDKALDAYQATLEDAGVRVVRRNRECVVARVAAPQTPRTVIETRRVGALDEFRRELTIGGHPAGTLLFLTPTVGESTYRVIDHEGTVVRSGGLDYVPALELLAHHYGLPMPIQVIEKD